MTDPREAPLNEAVRKTMSNLDAHFNRVEDRLNVDTKLFLARYDALCRHFGWRTAEIMPRLVTVEEMKYRIGDTAHIERRIPVQSNQMRVSGGAATIPLPARQTATAIMDYCASRPTIDWSCSKIAEMVANTVILDTYMRPECMFNHCPSVGLCQQDDRCRHPTDIP